eukprot:96353_1
MNDLEYENVSVTQTIQNSVITNKKNRKRRPVIDDNDIQKCLPECLQLYMINKQMIDISLDLKLIHPDINELFMKYNGIYFDNKLDFVIVEWSDERKEPINMYSNSGYCYQIRQLCYIYLSKPILEYTSTKEIIETLIHEMIHSYLFKYDQHKYDRSDHGKRFISIMNAINYCTKGIKIDIYHYCHKELDIIKLTIFQCNGICQKVVETPNNKPPGKHQKWWNKHKKECGGVFRKINALNGTEKKSILGKRGRKNDKKEMDNNDDIVLMPVKKKRKKNINPKKNEKRENVDSWCCELCTFINDIKRRKCEICNVERKVVVMLDMSEIENILNRVIHCTPK